MTSKFFGFLDRMKLIDRWALMRNTTKEDVAQHTMQVALIAHALCVIENKLFGGKLDAEKAAVLALYHESAEVVTGDLPTPVKYYDSAINKAYKNIESRAEKKLIETLPDELKDCFSPFVQPEKTSQEYVMVKRADKLSALIKCAEELASNNNEFKSAYDSTLKILSCAPEKSVKYFIDVFLPAYSESLDYLLDE
ncbi:MAG: 5'-deoxynucleotidase [Clostridiales bacterium]|nr:5'-deoxynucleotidase [Clostridiales bacterium]